MAERLEDIFMRWPETEHLATRITASSVSFLDATGARRDDGISTEDTIDVFEEFIKIAATRHPPNPAMLSVAGVCAMMLPKLRAFRDAPDKVAFLQAEEARAKGGAS